MATAREISDHHGHCLNMVEVRGHLYPYFFPLESLKGVSTFTPRPDDVILLNYPKSGTHWVYQIIRYLWAGSTDLSLVEADNVRLIELEAASSLEAMTGGRSLNTHVHYDTLGSEFFTHRPKLVYVTRDPRDVAVSFYHHLRDRPNQPYGGTFADFLTLFMEGRMYYDSWFDHTKGWEKCQDDYPDQPCLVLTFEDLKKEPLREIRKLAIFLEWNHTDSFLKEVVDKTSFTNMKSDRKHAQGTEPVMFVYRKGETGDWKNWFTAAQSERFNRLFEQEMAGTRAYRLYSHTPQ